MIFMQAHAGRVFTRYDFSALLNTAWMATMTPANICSEFRTCGSYPFDLSAIISCGVTSQNPESLDKSNVSTESEVAFTKDEVKVYQRRFEEGYNLFDEKCNVCEVAQTELSLGHSSL